jgi:5-methylcytosine-specific restriction endonuclease McrA
MEYRLEAFHRNVPNEVLIRDLRKVHATLKAENKNLTFRSYAKHGRYSAGTIAERFGDWNSALKLADIGATQERNISIDDLFDNMRSVWIAKGKQPVFRDMAQAPSRYRASTYAERFGGWRAALMEFTKSVASDQPETSRSVSAIIAKPSYVSKKTARQPNLRLKFRVMRRDRFMCIKCGRAPATHPGLVLEIDHILAWSRGGETCEANLQTLCYDCNRGKTDAADK